MFDCGDGTETVMSRLDRSYSDRLSERRPQSSSNLLQRIWERNQGKPHLMINAVTHFSDSGSRRLCHTAPSGVAGVFLLLFQPLDLLAPNDWHRAGAPSSPENTSDVRELEPTPWPVSVYVHAPRARLEWNDSRRRL